MKTKINVSPDDLNLLYGREKTVLQALFDGEKTRTTAERFHVTPARICCIRKRAMNRIARVKKLKALKERGDTVGLYMVKLDEVFPVSVVTPLKKYGYERVGDIRGKSDLDLLHFRGLGRKGIRIISEFFAEYGLEYLFPPSEEETLEDRVWKFMFAKCGLQRGCGRGATRMAAHLAVASGLVTEDSFQQVLSAQTPKEPVSSDSRAPGS